MSARSPDRPERAAAASWLPRWGRAAPCPSEAYTSQAVFDWEVEHFFEGGWVCVGRSRRPGRARRPARVPRSAPRASWSCATSRGSLRGFYNTCRHRGHELLEPGTARNLRAIKCPYHAWVYQLDGTLGAAPRFGDLDAFDKTDYPLIVARIHEWNGWIFVNPDGAAAPFESYVGNLDRADRGLGDGPPVRGRHARIRDRGELEDDHRELPRVLPLPVDPPGALRGDARPTRGRTSRTTALWVGGIHGPEGLRRDDVGHGRVAGRADPRPERRAAPARSTTSGCSPTCCSACTPTTS